VNEIYWSKKSLKQLKKFPLKHREQIHNSAEDLKTFPNCKGDIKQLIAHQYGYRLRIGNYRVFFNFDGWIKIINIREVKIRDSKTY
jgi:mRNA-degrading endonuclease RelE of RelBE toxin-antitoxin system